MRLNDVTAKSIPPPDLKLIIDKHRCVDVLVEPHGSISIKSFLRKVLKYLKV
jgi:hypothetical protein